MPSKRRGLRSAFIPLGDSENGGFAGITLGEEF